jgi:hypothetical protein
MSDQEKKTSISPQPDAENKERGELSEEELKKVAGGTPTATAKPQTQQTTNYLTIDMTNTMISGY